LSKGISKKDAGKLFYGKTVQKKSTSMPLKYSIFLILSFNTIFAQPKWEDTWGPSFTKAYAVEFQNPYLVLSTARGFYRSLDHTNWEKVNNPLIYPNFEQYSMFQIIKCGQRLFAPAGSCCLLYSDDFGLNWQ